MQKIDQACVNTLRFLAADQVEKAKSGHPGFPLGTAPLMYTIWDRYMSYNPPNRYRLRWEWHRSLLPTKR
ncbi:MAG: hypothetical protein ACI4QQ_02475, partial [Phascolarctobacterium sp.]